MKVLLSGASGLVGRALAERLRDAGHTIVPLVRHDPAPVGTVLWDPTSGRFDHAACEGIDAVVHLAGESVAAGRWTAARKRRIRDSRVAGTRLLVDGLRELEAPPAVFVAASAIGIYGSGGDDELTEDSPFGSGFLADVCRDWESASAPIEAVGTRRVLIRIGLVLARDGGALPRMAAPIRWFVGGRLGSGRQWMSWISRDDLCAIFERALADSNLNGVYNAVAPMAVRNAEFTRVLARVLRRPAFLPVPNLALRIAVGELATEILASARVVPWRLLDAGFRFGDTELEPTLRRLLTE